MTARNGRVAPIASAYPEFANLEPLPGRPQDDFRAAFEAFLARRTTPLTTEENQLAYHAARAAWRACWWLCAQARGDEERAVESPEPLSAHVVAEVEQLGLPAGTGRR